MVESPDRANERGFTLIEVMIVVAIIGVVSVLAAVGYGRWIAASKMAEATNMIGGIKNGEENYHAQTGYYLNVSKDIVPPYLYPRATPGPGKAAWGGTAGGITAADWQRLGVKADAPLYFAYAVSAENDTCDVACRGLNFPLSTGPVLWEKEAGGDIKKSWFIATAMADTNGNGVYAKVVGMSFNSRLIVDLEGE